MIELPCSQCGATLLAEDDWVGKKVKCPDCDGRTLVGPPTDEYATVPPNPPGIESETSTLSPSGAVPAAVWEAITVAGYEVLGELGRGGMGVVYKARHVKLGRLVALKMILVAEHAGQAERARFQTEAEAVARLQHPNIVQIYEIGEQDGRPFFSLEFCRRRIVGEETQWRSPAGEGGGTAGRNTGVGHARRSQGGYRPPRSEAGERPADEGRHAEDHRLRSGEEAR